MFSQKKNKSNNEEKGNEVQDLKMKLDQEFRVRNMPVLNRVTSTSVKKKSSQFSSSGLDSQISGSAKYSQKPHQTIGLIIISGGLLLILGLVYLSYLFIIKPSLSEVVVINTPIEQANNQIEEVVLTETEIASDESVEVEITNPVVLNLETPVGVPSSSGPLLVETMAEEGTLLSPVDLEPIIDSDEDGLYDQEELVLGTNIDDKDTNKNTYPDLVEVKNNYDPFGSGSLTDNPNLAVYTDNVYNYQLFYPRLWEFSSLNNNQVLIFTTPDESLIQISIQENSEHEDITSWYLKFFPDNLLTYNKIKIRDTWEGVEGEDSLNIYITDNAKTYIYTISYIPAVTGRIVYPNIFNMMFESLSLL